MKMTEEKIKIGEEEIYIKTINPDYFKKINSPGYPFSRSVNKVMFSLINSRLEEYERIMERIEKLNKKGTTLDDFVDKTNEKEYEEFKYIDGILLVYDLNNVLGNKFRYVFNFADKKIGIFLDDNKKTSNPEFYNLIKERMKTHEGADWVVDDEYIGNGTIDGVISLCIHKWVKEGKKTLKYNTPVSRHFSAN